MDQRADYRGELFAGEDVIGSDCARRPTACLPRGGGSGDAGPRSTRLRLAARTLTRRRRAALARLAGYGAAQRSAALTRWRGHLAATPPHAKPLVRFWMDLWWLFINANASLLKRFFGFGHAGWIGRSIYSTGLDLTAKAAAAAARDRTFVRCHSGQLPGVAPTSTPVSAGSSNRARTPSTGFSRKHSGIL